MTTAEQLPIAESIEQLRARRNASSVVALRRMQQEQDLAAKREIFEHVCDQESTHISEVLDGVVKTQVDFEIEDGQLVAQSEFGKINWQKFHEDNLKYAHQLVNEDAIFKNYLSIAYAEHEEGELQKQIAENGLPATMIVVSLCGDDILPHEALKKLGRQPGQQRAMVRATVFDGQTLSIQSRSVDHLDHQGARQILAELGVAVPMGANSVDILKSRAIINVADYRLVDQLIPAQHGVDTYKFVLDQPDLMNCYMESMMELAGRDLPFYREAELAEELRYDVMAAFRRRLQANSLEESSCSYGSLAGEIASAGHQARLDGVEFGGCDMLVSSSIDDLGYGTKSSEARRTCVNCPSCGKTVDADKDYFDAGFYHCPNCKATAAFRKGADMNKVKKLKSRQQNQLGLLEWWVEWNQKYKTDQAIKQKKRQTVPQ